jgi:hypothetical protein
MDPTQLQQMQNPNKPTIYSSFSNASLLPSYNPQFDNTFNISSNVNIVHGTPIVLDNMSLTTDANQPLQVTYPNLNMNSSYSLQHSTSYSTQKPVMSKHSFFYAPLNDFQMYYVICEEISLSFENISLMIDTDNDSTHNYVQFGNIYTFYHKQPEIEKIYRLTCEMVSHTFVFQFLNKTFFGIQFFQNEYQQQEFSKRHQENLKFHLRKDLIHYLIPKQTGEQNFNLFKGFIQDYYTFESMININRDILNHSQRYDANSLPISSQHDYNQGYYDNDKY